MVNSHDQYNYQSVNISKDVYTKCKTACQEYGVKQATIMDTGINMIVDILETDPNKYFELVKSYKAYITKKEGE